jgi:signal transduction histidine kinase
MTVWPVSDAQWMPGPRPRAGVLVAAALLFAAATLLHKFHDDPDDPVFLYALPVVLVAFQLGVAAGLVAAALAVGLDVAWAATTGADVDVVGVVSHAVAFALLAIVVGHLVDSRDAGSRRLRAVLDTMVDPFFVFRSVRDGAGDIVDFRCAYANDAGGALVDVSQAGTVRTWLSETSPSYLPRPMFERHRRLVETGEPLHVEEQVGERVVEIRAVRLGDGFTAAARDITERARFERRLMAARTELERSNSALSDFAHVVSHELSEPLATVSLFADTLDAGRARGIDDAELLALMRRALDRMQERISSLLSFAQVHQAPASRRRVDCAVLADEALASLQGSVSATGAQVLIDPLPTVDGHPHQLALLFENLLSNAIRFRIEGRQPEVAVSADRDDGVWHFAVKDRGPGVPAQDAERIFEPFVRAAGQKHPGSGIGLAVCRTVVELHGGRIWVESARDTGSTFHFTLP